MTTRSNSWLGPIMSVVPILLLSANLASAGEPRTHDGFFLRLGVGGGSANAKIEPSGGSLEFSGGAFDLSMAIGGCVQDNLMLHATFFGWTIENPRADLNVTGAPSQSSSPKGTLDLSAIGGGLTYFFMPANVFISGSVGSGALTGESDLDGTSEDGFAFELAAGKEWWVRDSWGLGGALAVSYFSAKDKTFLGVPDNWSGLCYAIRFTATLN